MLLCEIEDYGLYDEWIKEYESNIGKIDYRDILIEKYNELKGIVILQVLFYIEELVFHQTKFFYYTLIFLRWLVTSVY